MLCVLIVDDEPIFRMGLRSGINWADLDCEIIGEASNGKEALSIIEEKKPNIILLDIKMPGMDGIELLKNCRQHPDNQCFIVLSCFNEYPFVREAMKLGALDYLFKPLMEGPDIEKVIMEAKEQLGFSSRSSEAAEHQNAVRTKLKEIIENGVSANISPLLELIPQLSSSHYFTMALMVQDEHIDTEKAYVLLDSSQALIAGFFPSCTCFFTRCGEILYALIYTDNCNGELVSSHILRTWGKRVSDYMEAAFWTGFDNPSCDITCLPESFRHARYAMEANYFRQSDFKTPCVHLYTPGMQQNYDFYEIFPAEVNNIRNATQNYDMETIRKSLRHITESIRVHEYFNKEDFCHLLTALITDSMRIYRTKIVLEQLLLSNYNLISDIYHQRTMEDAEHLFFQVILTLFAHLKGNTTGFHTRIIQETIEYINLHYQEKLSLDMVAEKTHLSVNYFCKLFKDQTGDTFINYLNKVRIHAAVHLLQTTTWKTYEIADAVGFSDYHHFCKTFKKITELTPSQVRDPNCIS